jgi:DNA-binding NarL/FixJ family response regulator
MKILLGSDHTLIREGMRHVLRELDDELVLLEVENCEAGLDLANIHADLDLVLLDLSMPGTHVPDVLSQLRKLRPALPVVMLSAASDPEDVISVFEHGAMGYIPKAASNSILLSALRLVLLGGTYIPSEILLRKGSEKAAPYVATESASFWKAVPSSVAQAKLTRRQMQVLAQMAQGKSNKMIARDLGMAMGTVKTHVTAILKTLKVNNRTQAVVAGGADADVVPFAPMASSVSQERAWRAVPLPH